MVNHWSPKPILGVRFPPRLLLIHFYMKILALETSCDDTGLTIVDFHKNDYKILVEKTASQIDIHKEYGGVVPELAARSHADNIFPLLRQSFDFKKNRLDAIAVTNSPGLITGLLVGTNTAKILSFLLNIPIIPVNHLEGHIFSVIIKNNLKQLPLPAIALLISGGHTQLVLIDQQHNYKIIGKTLDDAVGECFDKVGKLLNLEYPGGPKISKLAEKGQENFIKFPRPMLNKNNFDFSFSGLKTAALYWLQKNKLNNNIHNFCASFEKAIIDVLIKKTIKAAQHFKINNILIAGGVSANKKLRQEFNKFNSQYNIYFPQPQYSMDNATMIALAAYHQVQKNNFIDWRFLKADPNKNLN